MNRLVQAINPLPYNPLELFNYDPVGNRTNSNQNGSSIFNSANQLSEDANFTYQYDNNGNMTRKTAQVGGAVTQYEYDAENKLLRVVKNGSGKFKRSGVFSQCRDKDSLDIFWLSNESLEESDNLPDPDVLAQKSSKISKPLSNNSVKSPRFLNGAELIQISLSCLPCSISLHFCLDCTEAPYN